LNNCLKSLFTIVVDHIDLSGILFKHLGHTEQLQQSCICRFVGCLLGKNILGTVINASDMLYGDTESTLLWLIELHYTRKRKSEFKEGDLYDFTGGIKTEILIYSTRHIFVHVSSEAFAFISVSVYETTNPYNRTSLQMNYK
jgi:hypothetical protein